MYQPTARYGSPLSSVKRCWPACPSATAATSSSGNDCSLRPTGMLWRGPVEHREPTALDGEVLHPFLRLRRLVEDRDELGGVAVGLGLGGGGPLVDQRAAGERVCQRREAEAGEHRDQPEEHRDPSAQAERTAIGHGDSVTRPRQTAWIAAKTKEIALPVRRQGEEGTPPGQREQLSSWLTRVTGARWDCAFSVTNAL